MRGLLLLVAAAFALTLSGAAAASVLGSRPSTTPAPDDRSDKTETTEDLDSGVHGGPIDRFQKAGACDLTDVSALSGKWTHGDYVSAVAQAGDPSLVPVAARSDCGKPMVAVGHGGPPAHALEHIPEGTPNAASQAQGEGPPGS